MTRLCLDIDLTPHVERKFDPSAQKEVAKTQEDTLNQITRCILHSTKLQHLTLTSIFFNSFLGHDIFPKLLRIISLDNLKSITLDGLPCSSSDSSADDGVGKIGLSSKLERLVLRLRCQSRVEYANWVKWFLMQIKEHKSLQVVVIEPYTHHIMQEAGHSEEEVDHFQSSLRNF